MLVEAAASHCPDFCGVSSLVPANMAEPYYWNPRAGVWGTPFPISHFSPAPVSLPLPQLPGWHPTTLSTRLTTRETLDMPVRDLMPAIRR